MRSSVERLGVEPVDTAGARLDATRYRLAGDLSCEFWYADQRWCKLRFRRERRLDDRLRARIRADRHAAWIGRA